MMMVVSASWTNRHQQRTGLQRQRDMMIKQQKTTTTTIIPLSVRTVTGCFSDTEDLVCCEGNAIVMTTITPNSGSATTTTTPPNNCTGTTASTAATTTTNRSSPIETMLTDYPMLAALVFDCLPPCHRFVAPTSRAFSTAYRHYKTTPAKPRNTANKNKSNNRVGTAAACTTTTDIAYALLHESTRQVFLAEQRHRGYTLSNNNNSPWWLRWWPKNPLVLAAQFGQINTLGVLLQQQLGRGYDDLLSPAVSAAAAGAGHLDCLIWLKEKVSAPWGPDVCAAAARHGHLHCLRYLSEQGCSWDASTCEAAAGNGHLDCLQYAHEHGCSWGTLWWCCGGTIGACAAAAAGGHLDCLRYAREHGCWWWTATCHRAASHGHLHCLRYAHEQGCLWWFETTTSAAKGGHLECLRYAHEHGCQWNRAAVSSALEYGHLECLRYACEHGCPVWGGSGDTAGVSPSLMWTCWLLSHWYCDDDDNNNNDDVLTSRYLACLKYLHGRWCRQRFPRITTRLSFATLDDYVQVWFGEFSFWFYFLCVVYLFGRTALTAYDVVVAAMGSTTTVATLIAVGAIGQLIVSVRTVIADTKRTCSEFQQVFHHDHDDDETKLLPVYTIVVLGTVVALREVVFRPSYSLAETVWNLVARVAMFLTSTTTGRSLLKQSQ